MLVALYIFGGEVIRNFNFAMLFGVVIGTYSSIFIAAPLLGYLGVKREWARPGRQEPAKARRAAQGRGARTWPSNEPAHRRAIPGGRRSMPTATAASASPR